MHFRIAAIGRVKSGPEAQMIDDYAARLAKLGRPLSLGPLSIDEHDNRKHKGATREAELLRQSIPDGAMCVAMDERGAQVSSRAFAQKLEGWRDDGYRDLVFLIGAADGLDRALVQSAGFTLSLGKMVWPHMLARVMLAEQLYRAVSILANQPYHRD